MFRSGKKEANDNNIQFTSSSSHINLFADLEAEYQKNLGVGNRDYELEKKKEREEYEKKVGILHYLGQGSSELTKVRFLDFTGKFQRQFPIFFPVYFESSF